MRNTWGCDGEAVWHGDVLFIRDGDGFDLA